ncbi:MAG: UDP-3-O-(3-hydroxymyristoyl)glucosamine N-acyltransferase [Fibrobacter sp.]|jgi:UDP-3-O-[3-hydroxymyristoyl] glucosamine N-acyltransferase|nr:UDP-3-O-(3-hydroxymyristoyl)glucosamine N-acyltransferase [Fibrobacter sp.]
MGLRFAPIPLEEILRFLNAGIEFLQGSTLSEISGIAPLETANENEIAFWSETSVSGSARNTKAGALLVPARFDGIPDEAKAIIRVENPYHETVRLLNRFYIPCQTFPESVIAPSARIHESAVVEGSVGENAEVGAFCVIPKGASVGADSRLEARATLYANVHLGKRAVVQAGAVIGSRGFGFYAHEGKRIPVPHPAGVIAGDDCEFGANMVVAAGFLEPTRIGDRCRFDSFVQIGHNSRLGNDIYMASQSGVSGSVIVEDGVELGGGAQVAGHLTLGTGVQVAAKAGVTRSIAPGQTVSGFPAIPIAEWRRQMVNLRKMGNK